jgi:hypothetical protein
VSRATLPPEMDEENVDPYPVDVSKGGIHNSGYRVQSSTYEKPKAKEHGQKACMAACDKNMTGKGY